MASPNILLPNPAGLSYVTVEFDICYNTEDDPDFNYLAYDGATLRITDFTAGRTARAALLEAYSAPLTTGAINHFPKHLPRSSDPNYFQDMSVWAGASGGFKHVFARVFGMQGSTVQLRPDYTQDGSGICTDAGHAPPCGVMIDNFVVKSVTFNAALVDLSIPIATATPGTVAPGNNVTYNFTVAASNSGFNAANVVLTDPLPATLTFVSAVSPAGWSCVTPAVGTNGTITCTNPSVASNTTSAFTFVVNVPGSTGGGVTFNNTATVATDSPETTTANNSGTASFITSAGARSDDYQDARGQLQSGSDREDVHDHDNQLGWIGDGRCGDGDRCSAERADRDRDFGYRMGLRPAVGSMHAQRCACRGGELPGDHVDRERSVERAADGDQYRDGCGEARPTPPTTPPATRRR